MTSLAWAANKKRINDMPSEVIPFLKSLEKDGIVKYSFSGKYRRAEAQIDKNIRLIAYLDMTGGLKAAHYVAFSNDDSQCYVRKIS